VLLLLQPLLVENIEEELDPVLDPVLERRLVKKGKSWVLQLADKEVRASFSSSAPISLRTCMLKMLYANVRAHTHVLNA
jgi:hypothetical protein